MNKKMLLGLILSAVVLIGALAGFGVSVSKKNETTDLGIDLSSYNITKMDIADSGLRIVGTQNGEVLAFDEEGEIRFNVGRLSTQAVYDITTYEDTVYVVYANGTIYSFSAEAASAYEGESFAEECVRYSVGMGFEQSGNVRNTQIIVAEDGNAFYLRGIFNDQSDRNQIYRFERGETAGTELLRSSRALGGMALGADGTVYYSSGSALYRLDGTAPVSIASLNETLTAVSLSDGILYTVSAENNLFAVNPQTGEWSTYALGVTLDSNYIFSSGENFLAKIRNGGVAMIDSASRRVTLTMRADDTANPIMWTDDGFMLRDTKDVTNPTIIYYSVSLAHSVSLFSALFYLFLILWIAALICTLYFAFGMKERYRAKINGLFRRFFKELWRSKVCYISLIVPFALLITFYYIPTFLGFGLSFLDYIPGEKSVFVGFTNYIAVVTDPGFWNAAGTMLIFLVADLLKALIPPVILAECILAVRFKRFSLWTRILLFLPGILPGVATTLVWQRGIFDSTQNSLMNAFIGIFVPGFVKNWLSSASTATSICTLIAFGFPWIGSYLIFYGAMMGIDNSIFEAAKLDGSSWGRRIVEIDLPLIFPQIKYVFITSFIASVQNYTSLYIIYGAETTASIKTPALLMYGEIMRANYGVASVMGILIFAFLSVATVLNFRMQSRSER